MSLSKDLVSVLNSYSIIKREKIFEERFDSLSDNFGSPKVKKIRVCSWTKPPPPKYKLNIDGSFKEGSNLSGYGGILRDYYALFIKDFSGLEQASSSLHIEAIAVLKGIEIIEDEEVIVESDCLHSIKIINKKTRCPWKIYETMEKVLEEIKKKKKIEIRHTYRQGNLAADFLAKCGCSCSTTDIRCLGSKLEGIARLDRSQTPCVGC